MNLPTALLIAWIRAAALFYGVEPEFALAVAHVESGTATQEFRLGPLGKKGIYAGPFGLHRAYCREHFGLDPLAPETNIMIGVKALRGRDQRRVLQRYNRSFNESYYRAVQRAQRHYRRESRGYVGR
ncbi:MAG: hypothetical protein M1438_04825 [Deltaproteobacteria bacterium]|nr:hypothetical protein [Deltaproteobacteria bacterium]